MPTQARSLGSSSSSSKALNREVCDNNNTRTATTDCSAPVLTEGGTYSPSPCSPTCSTSTTSRGRPTTSTTLGGAETASTAPGAAAPGRLASAPTRRSRTRARRRRRCFQDPCPYNNAFFSPFTPASASQVFYGQAWTADDIVAHELTHGVTNFESALVYQNESGAMNESLSDVFGESVDLVNGAGTDTAATAGRSARTAPLGCGVLRDMEAPPAFNDPDKMTSRSGVLTGRQRSRPQQQRRQQQGDVPAHRRADVQHLHGQPDRAREGDPRSTTRRRPTSSPREPTTARSATRCGRRARTSPARTGSSPPTAPRSTTRSWRPRWTPRRATPDTQYRQRPGNNDDPTPTWTFSVSGRSCQGFTTPNPGSQAWPAPRTSARSTRERRAGLRARGRAAATRRASDLADGNYTFRVRGSIGIEHGPDAGDAGLHRLDGRHGAGLEVRQPGPGVRGREPDLHDHRPQQRPRHGREREVVDVLPAGTTYQSSSIPCTDSPRERSPAGSATSPTTSRRRSRSRSRSHAISSTINGSPTTITNQATADSDRNDRDSSNDSKSESTLVKAKADLAIVSFGADRTRRSR